MELKICNIEKSPDIPNMNRLNDDSQLKDTIIYSKGKNFSYFYRVSWCILLNNVYEVNICCFLFDKDTL